MGEPRRDFRLFPGRGSGGAEAELLRTPGEESAVKTFARPQSKKNGFIGRKIASRHFATF